MAEILITGFHNVRALNLEGVIKDENPALPPFALLCIPRFPQDPTTTHPTPSLISAWKRSNSERTQVSEYLG
jgi:hypothetical protein